MATRPPQLAPACPTKRRDPFEFEQEFRLIYQLSPTESQWPDDKEDEHRWVLVDSRHLVQLIRFHPKATPEFKAAAGEDIAASGLQVPIEPSMLAEATAI